VEEKKKDIFAHKKTTNKRERGKKESRRVKLSGEKQLPGKGGWWGTEIRYGKKKKN